MSIASLYIDADNVSPDIIDMLMDKAKEFGRVSIRYIYGDFSKQEMCGWKHASTKYGIQQILVPSLSGKNSTDIKICIDIIDSVHRRPFIDTYIIATSDSDFIHIAYKLKDYGKEVYFITDYCINKHIIPVCDGHTIIGNYSSESDVDNGDDDALDTILKKIDELLDDKPINLSKLNQDLINMMGFNYKHFGASSMIKFVDKYCKDKYKYTIDSNGAYISKID